MSVSADPGFVWIENFAKLNVWGRPSIFYNPTVSFLNSDSERRLSSIESSSTAVGISYPSATACIEASWFFVKTRFVGRLSYSCLISFSVFTKDASDPVFFAFCNKICSCFYIWSSCMVVGDRRAADWLDAPTAPDITVSLLILSFRNKSLGEIRAYSKSFIWFRFDNVFPYVGSVFGLEIGRIRIHNRTPNNTNVTIRKNI